MAVATGPVGSVSTGPLFVGKVMKVQYHQPRHNCLFRAYAVHLLHKRGRHSLAEADRIVWQTRVEIRFHGREGGSTEALQAAPFYFH